MSSLPLLLPAVLRPPAPPLTLEQLRRLALAMLDELELMDAIVPLDALELWKEVPTVSAVELRGRSLAELIARRCGDEKTLKIVLAEEVRLGRVLLDADGNYSLCLEAFPPDIVLFLRDVRPE